MNRLSLYRFVEMDNKDEKENPADELDKALLD